MLCTRGPLLLHEGTITGRCCRQNSIKFYLIYCQPTQTCDQKSLAVAGTPTPPKGHTDTSLHPPQSCQGRGAGGQHSAPTIPPQHSLTATEGHRLVWLGIFWRLSGVSQPTIFSYPRLAGTSFPQRRAVCAAARCHGGTLLLAACTMLGLQRG